jgi:predicted metal-binding membrane protein
MLAMWIIMMVGMMVPSAIPMILIYASVVRKAAREGSSLAATEVFVAGYIAIWLASRRSCERATTMMPSNAAT